MKKEKITAKDVAAYAGVSPTTVSMILSGKGVDRFPEKTFRRVIDACNELGYVRSKTFSAEAGDDKVIIAVIPSLSNYHFAQAIEAMQGRAKELGYALLTFDTFRERSQEARIIQICTHFPFAGVVFFYPPENGMFLQQLEWAKPVVLVYDKGAYDDMNIMEFDGLRVGTVIGEHLLSLGHERIAFLTMDFESKQTMRVRRLEGLRAVYEANGFDPSESVKLCTPKSVLPQVKTALEGYELGYLVTKQLLEQQENLTAFVGLNDMIAVGAIDAIIDAGKRVPEDYSVCGCDNTNISKYRRISLTSVESYTRQMAREGMDILIRKIQGDMQISELEDSPDGVTRIEYFPKLIVRKSTGPRAKRPPAGPRDGGTQQGP